MICLSGASDASAAGSRVARYCAILLDERSFEAFDSSRLLHGCAAAAVPCRGRESQDRKPSAAASRADERREERRR
jgi:hypothetical protein